MEVTEVRLRGVHAVGKMRGIASITLDGEFVIHDVRIIGGKNGLFDAMPSKRTADGVFRVIAHPINLNMRKKIQEAVVNAIREHENQDGVVSYENYEGNGATTLVKM